MVKHRIWAKPVLAAFTLPVQVSTVGLTAVSQANYMADTFYFIIQADASYPPGMTSQRGLGCCQRSVSSLLRSSQILPSSMRKCSRGLTFLVSNASDVPYLQTALLFIILVYDFNRYYFSAAVGIYFLRE